MGSKKKGLKIETKNEKLCTFKVYLPLVRVTYTVKNVVKSFTVGDFKKLIEIVCGVPTTLQRLHYLDLSDLEDNCTLGSLDIVNKSTFILNIWRKWELLVQLVYKRDFKTLSDSVLRRDQNSPIPLVASFEKRCETALFIASKLGYVDMVRNLIILGVNVNSCTDLGYSSLHVALANGQYKCIDFLLENGAKNDTKINEFGKFALHIAKQYNHNDSERHLYLFEWQLRAKTTKCKPSRQVELLMHQKHDSKVPTWFDGSYGTRFMCRTIPFTEFSGTHLSSPRAKVVKPLYTDDKEYFSKTDTGASRIHSYITHENWLQKKKEEELQVKETQKLLQQIEQQRREREENDKKRLLSQRHRENEKRSLAVQDSLSSKNRNKQVMYEEFSYAPGYSKSFLQQFVNNESFLT